MICKHCKEEIPDSYRFCFHCGNEMPRKREEIIITVVTENDAIDSEVSYADKMLKFKEAKNIRNKERSKDIAVDKYGGKIIPIIVVVALFLIFINSYETSSYKSKAVKDWSNKDYNDFMNYKDSEYQKRVENESFYK
ncbi:zinc ribbon domain-containing protein [Paenibacillus sp. FSL H3-0286]|uniref:zinc ribbon domain-containing protein n=1 Tax=Paenibacillus sp. FSL H3-0286 TaxID=2921427 RepID=UPI00324B7725